MKLYRKRLKSWNLARRLRKFFCLERATIVGVQGASEDKKFAAKPTPPNSNFSAVFGIAILFFIRLYQLCLSPFLGKCCRFYPSCSDYAMEAVKKYGAVRGTWLVLKRLVKCQPWHPGGIDEVP